ncbi:hypothetical protein [Sphingorhabdus sp. SMR4y]|uniref:hypothetical protein n=1 Tax=Sphingorhabdus sp. SMR4y TaxID=2584094 RepID=UPI000B5DDC7A|nr:hypothetical protein [Sphingorhabdus sp. SMR4y]ASK86817.1 hypothetical protein SPHFLASMR4Y_00023 [Sphingorhabdus sp. SMR4y]
MNRSEEFEYQIEAARKVMRKDRRVLAALAEFDRTGKFPDWVEAELEQEKSKD